MSKRLDKLCNLIETAAVNHIAVNDFEVIEGDDNERALYEFSIERDNSLLELINHILLHGQMLKIEILAEQAEAIASAPSFL